MSTRLTGKQLIEVVRELSKPFPEKEVYEHCWDIINKAAETLDSIPCHHEYFYGERRCFKCDVHMDGWD